MIKLFATDLDGTLLKENKYITEKDQNMLRQLYQQGIEIAFATGRSDSEILRLFEQIGIKGHRVSQNGTFVYSKNDDTISERHFKQDISLQLIDEIEGLHLPYFVSTKHDIFFTEHSPFIEQIQGLFHSKLKHLPNLNDAISNGLKPSKFMVLGETEPLKVIQKQMSTKFNHEMESFLSDPRCIDIVPSGVNKANGLEHLMRHLEIEKQDIAVVGDSYNDIPMLNMTENSYVMTSAATDVKVHASSEVQHVYEVIEALQFNLK
ncbi:hypothetical protein SAMN05421734_10412 [Pelagirhabdus alkalitolerans]|uniref:Cof subfamily of IIB subfamily of haloacid dehalogenase superfamily/HAD-superfamily hydrolase, subfamily IIB n=1 Tax=Pelagirhabdus alkalitolerans TaxID=1612202 RepID=A0A1G6IH40_9BACI|nr:HAD family hydrolase [Pelagirhabdus alkalitolerans]SDC05066.1 hypothetical protein SAMN05421734_10412 [Pelagirhabdus alkalitolerans]